jgi:hypothetical protein
VCEVTKVLEIKKFGGWRLIWQLWNYLPSNFGNSILTHTKAELGAFYGISSWWRALLAWEFLAKLETCTFRSLFQGIGWCVANIFVLNIWRFNIVLVSNIFYILQVVECRAINKSGRFEFLWWFITTRKHDLLEGQLHWNVYIDQKVCAFWLKVWGMKNTCYIWLKWPFWPSIKSKIWSKWTNVDHDLIKLAVLNG